MKHIKAMLIMGVALMFILCTSVFLIGCHDLQISQKITTWCGPYGEPYCVTTMLFGCIQRTIVDESWNDCVFEKDILKVKKQQYQKAVKRKIELERIFSNFYNN